MYTNLENFLANLSFFTLFIAMFSYWAGFFFIDLQMSEGGLIAQKNETKRTTLDPYGVSYQILERSEGLDSNQKRFNSNPDITRKLVDFTPEGGKIHKKGSRINEQTSFKNMSYERSERRSELFMTAKPNIGIFNITIHSLLITKVRNLFIYFQKIFKIRTPITLKPRLFLMCVSNLSVFFLLILRWMESGHFPLSNLYESLMFLSWSSTLIHILFYFLIFLNIWATPKTFDLMLLLGSITAPFALFTNAFATLSLPKEMQNASALVPALQSNWLMMHVTVMIISYATLIIGSLLAIAFLFITSNSNTLLFLEPDKNKLNIKPHKSYFSNSLAKTLDNLSYRILGLGFPFLTIGILSGAVWANEAWGSYWSWDPKETWALLTWLVFAIYLHTRITKGWNGKKPAIIASLGFITVWICYLGVNLLGEGLHSYGFF